MNTHENIIDLMKISIYFFALGYRYAKKTHFSVMKYTQKSNRFNGIIELFLKNLKISELVMTQKHSRMTFKRNEIDAKK